MLAIGVAVALSRSLAAVLTWSIAAIGFMGATQVFSLPMEPRQLSVLWLALVASIWIAGSDEVERRTAAMLPPRQMPERPMHRAAVLRGAGAAFLVAGLLGVVGPIVTEMRVPFRAVRPQRSG